MNVREGKAEATRGTSNCNSLEKCKWYEKCFTDGYKQHKVVKYVAIKNSVGV